MLTGLIIACEEAAEGDLLRAELPVAGQTVLEQQVRLLAEMGAARIIVIADRLPEALAAAANRLRRDGIAVELVRQAEEVTQRLLPVEQVLMLADGVVIDQASAELVLAAPAPAILTVPDSEETRAWELIDASARWAGVMLVDGDLVRRTARMLGDWDLQSTLLRNAVQAGAARIDLSAAAATSLLAQIDDADSALAAEQAISRSAARRHVGLLDKYVFDPIARALAPRAMAARLDPAWLRAGACGLTLVAALVVLGGWWRTGLAIALLAGPADVLGQHLAALGLRGKRDQRAWTRWRQGASAAGLLALGYALSVSLGWGSIAVAASTLALMVALHEHERWIGKPMRRPLWLAEPDILIWLLFPFALAGWWTAGLAAQAGYAFASLLKMQRLTGRKG